MAVGEKAFLRIRLEGKLEVLKEQLPALRAASQRLGSDGWLNFNWAQFKLAPVDLDAFAHFAEFETGRSGHALSAATTVAAVTCLLVTSRAVAIFKREVTRFQDPS